MRNFSILAAILIPAFYLFYYTPYGMDTTDFGYFYGYAWRILQGEAPYRDFFYIKPALSLYWHAFWLWLTPFNWQILAGKAGFCLTLLASAWLSALYFRRFFKLAQMKLPVSLLATCGFVFSVHSFPHMPWHTADGALFCSASLFCAAYAWPALSGVFAACAIACKQSFLLVPFALGFLILLVGRPRQLLRFLGGLAFALAFFYGWLVHIDALGNFRAMTTGQLDIREALDAGIFIYLRQNWGIPLLALLPLALFRVLKRPLPQYLAPGYCYLAILLIWYVFNVYSQKTWIGFGSSWPTLWVLLGCALALCPRFFAESYFDLPEDQARRALCGALIIIAPLLASWSIAISGGYKIPAMLATPLIFFFLLFHARFFGAAQKLAWLALATGLIMFWAGYQYPYVFPARPLARADLIYDAGEIYPQATGVKVDRDMYERLAELKALRAKYGSSYKTLPGFPFSYYLNGDKPRISSDWLIDWEINGKVDQLYNELLDRDIAVFMERDQMHATQADSYARAGYGVPQRVVKNWRMVEKTPHFAVFQKPIADR